MIHLIARSHSARPSFALFSALRRPAARQAPAPNAWPRVAPRHAALSLAFGLTLTLAGCGNDVVYVSNGTCQAGYQDNDHDGMCAPGCSLVGLACPNGHCSDATGTPRCECNEGLVDDGNGNCLPASGNGCDTAIDLLLAPGSVQGSTAGQGDDSAGSCQSSGSEDVVYRFGVGGPVHVRFHAAGFDTALYVRSTCAQPTSELACVDDGPDGIAATLEADLPVGLYYLFVDGKSGQAGPYALTIELTCPEGQIFDPGTAQCLGDPCTPNPCVDPHKQQCVVLDPLGHECHCDPGYVDDPEAPSTCILDPASAGDTCASALELPVEAQGTVSGNNTSAHGDYQGSCAGGGPERVYSFTVAETMRAEFLMTGYDTVLYLRSSCEDAGSELACNDDSEQLSAGIVRTLSPGTYYLFADSYDQADAYQLHYGFRTDPCAGDPCPGAPECVANFDWSSYECVCPPGTLPYGNGCVDDPCEPNPCVNAADHRTRCQPHLDTSDYSCACSVGYIDDPASPGGTCLEDPNAKDWAFFVFLNGDNNLEPNAYQNLAQMQSVGSNADVDIVVLLDSESQDGGTARKLYVTQGGATVVEDMGEIDMGDWHTLADFGSWAVSAYPARHQALILWDHGDGWRASPPAPALLKGFSNDDHGSAEGISISNGDYARALQAIVATRGDKLDLVGFDACLMGMWEVTSATAPYARTFVGSEEVEPADGWRYDVALSPLVASPEATATDLGTWIADGYQAASSDNSTIAVMNLDALPAMAGPMTDFANALLADPTWYDKVEQARQASQAFYFPEYVDLTDFTERTRNGSGASAAVLAAADSLLAELGVVIVHNQAQPSYPGAHGLSVYLPARHVAPDLAYAGVGAVWSQTTTWDEFLESFGQ